MAASHPITETITQDDEESTGNEPVVARTARRVVADGQGIDERTPTHLYVTADGHLTRIAPPLVTTIACRRRPSLALSLRRTIREKARGTADLRGTVIEHLSDRIDVGSYLGTEVLILRESGYINANRLCAMGLTQKRGIKAGGKPREACNWIASADGKEAIAELEEEMGRHRRVTDSAPDASSSPYDKGLDFSRASSTNAISSTWGQGLETTHGVPWLGPHVHVTDLPINQRGVYVHPDLALRVVAWACPSKLRVVSRIVETYSTDIVNEALMREAALTSEKAREVIEAHEESDTKWKRDLISCKRELREVISRNHDLASRMKRAEDRVREMEVRVRDEEERAREAEERADEADERADEAEERERETKEEADERAEVIERDRDDFDDALMDAEEENWVLRKQLKEMRHAILTHTTDSLLSRPPPSRERYTLGRDGVTLIDGLTTQERSAHFVLYVSRIDPLTHTEWYCWSGGSRLETSLAIKVAKYNARWFSPSSLLITPKQWKQLYERLVREERVVDEGLGVYYSSFTLADGYTRDDLDLACHDEARVTR
jgi:flagellar biosynthesis GTPase FlhF